MNDTSAKKVLLSGVQPTGRPHIGNYFGAMRQYVELQETYESYIFIADYHALTTIQDKDTLADLIFNLAVDYLALGLDPNKVTLYRQSAVPQVTEAAWIFNCLVTVPYLERAHAFKDKVVNNQIPSMGLFDYPVLMAADILLPRADVVPVGADQKQHIEYARDIALKFNTTFGETLSLPEPLILTDVATVPGIDGRKMSKSYGNDIYLFASEEELKQRVMSIVTSSVGVGESLDPETDNVFALHKLFATPDEITELEDRYRTGSIGYKEAKDLLWKQMNNFLAPLRDRRAEIATDKDFVTDVLAAGGKKAYARYEETIAILREKIGL
jgi:tryptophanyl-tRNA synthetase